MKVDFKLAGVDSTRKLLKLYEKHVGKGVADGVKEMANSSARSLAMRVQPYGLTDKKMAIFAQNIGRQIDFVSYAVRTGEAFGAQTLAAGHNALRKNGKVRTRRLRSGEVVNPIPQGEVEQYRRQQMGKAGRAKAGWLDCAIKLGGKLSGVGSLIKRHVKGNWGHVSGIGTKNIVMINQTPYLTGPQKDKDVRYALALGRKNGLQHIAKQIRGAIKKAERETKRASIRMEKAQTKKEIKSSKFWEKSWENRHKLPPKPPKS